MGHAIPLDILIKLLYGKLFGYSASKPMSTTVKDTIPYAPIACKQRLLPSEAVQFVNERNNGRAHPGMTADC